VRKRLEVGMADDDADNAADAAEIKKTLGPRPQGLDAAGQPNYLYDSQSEEYDAKAEQIQARNLAQRMGCGLPIAVAIFVIIAIAAFFAIESRNDNCNSSPPRRDGMQLAACQKPADTAANSTSDASSSSADTASSSSSSSGGTAGGGTAAIAPPASVPPGQILFQGETGDNIGPIAQDGKNRFVSLTGPGVTTDGNSVTITWDKGAGKVVSFGSNLHTSTNKGRYGFALFRNVPATPPTTSPSGEAESQYRAGCAIEVGQTSCKSDTAGAPIVNGDRVTIIIGEAGTGVGDYSADWWFVYQPD
jgi:hypothetical protein